MVESVFNRFVTAIKDIVEDDKFSKEEIKDNTNVDKNIEITSDGKNYSVVKESINRIHSSNALHLSASSSHFIDEVPTEDLPIPIIPCSEGFSPSLDYSACPPNVDILGKSPSFFDRSIDFLKREIDTIKFNFATRPTLTHEQWFMLFNEDGQMIRPDDFYKYLFNYEWPKELLQDGWKYLFEYYPTFSNHTERVSIDKCKFTKLHDIVNSWNKILDETDGGEDQQRIKKLIYLVNKDVPRTDRDMDFYRCNEENSEILRDLLVTFSYANPDIGYVQGMNDLLSMFLMTIDDNVAAYWSYNNYIMKNKLFFNSTGLMAKLNSIAELLARQDRELYEKLGTLDCKDMLFCQRWILLGFRRECNTFDISVNLFTTINSLQPSHYLIVQDIGRCELLSMDMFLALAILIRYRCVLLSFSDQTQVYQWVGQLKISDMSLVHHAKQMYDVYAEDEIKK